LRLGLSLGWLAGGASSTYPNALGLGFLPAEIGVGVRFTNDMALALLGRAGILHAGGGIEFTAIQDDWSHDGSMFRLAAMVLRDGVTCFRFDGPERCSTAVYLLGEVGFQYRWSLRTGRAVSLGVSVQIGAMRLNGSPGPSVGQAFGLLGPRLQVEL
jgi:hypothetical protein